MAHRRRKHTCRVFQIKTGYWKGLWVAKRPNDSYITGTRKKALAACKGYR